MISFFYYKKSMQYQNETRKPTNIKKTTKIQIFLSIIELGALNYESTKSSGSKRQ